MSQNFVDGVTQTQASWFNDVDYMMYTLLGLSGGDGSQTFDSTTALTALGVSAFAQTLTDDTSAAGLLTTLGLDTDLLTLSLPATTTISAYGATLVDDASATAARTTLGLGSIATATSGAYIPIGGGTATGDITIAKSGAGSGGVHPRLILEYSDTAAGATGDGLGGLLITGSDDATPTPAVITYARIMGRIADPSSGAAYGLLDFRVLNGGGVFDVCQMEHNVLWIADNKDGATAGPLLNLIHGRNYANSNTLFSTATADAGQDNDVLGRINFRGFNDAATPESVNYSYIVSKIIDASDGAEKGLLRLGVPDGSGSTIEYEIDETGFNLIDKLITRPVMKDYGITHQVNASASGSVSLDYSAGQSFKLTLAGNVTNVTVTNPPASGTYGEIVIMWVQDTTDRTIAYGGEFKWAGGTASAHSMSTGSGVIDFVTARTIDGGTTWYADYQQAYG